MIRSLTRGSREIWLDTPGHSKTNVPLITLVGPPGQGAAIQIIFLKLGKNMRCHFKLLLS